jgi:hypothetical protein
MWIEQQFHLIAESMEGRYARLTADRFILCRQVLFMALELPLGAPPSAIRHP